MAANRLSLNLTTAYRQRLDLTRQRVGRTALTRWPSSIETLSETTWPAGAAAVVMQAQIEAIRATSGYLTAFLTSELRRRASVPAIDSLAYAGASPDGRPLEEAFQSPLIAVRAALKEGKSDSEALAAGLARAKRQIGMAFDSAHRTALLEAIDADERFDGWLRATAGTCGACLAVASKVQHGLSFPVHPGCHCVSEPVVAGVGNAFPRLTGAQIFAAKSEAEQDEALGPEAAGLVREGRIDLADLVQHEELDSDQPGFITQRPVDQLVPTH